MENSKKIIICSTLIVFYLILPLWVQEFIHSPYYTKIVSHLQLNANDLLINRTYIKIILYFIYFVLFFVFCLFCLRQFDFYNLKIYFLATNRIGIWLKEIEKDDKHIWKDIVFSIESTHHSSILSKIKDLDTETTINLPKYNPKYDFNAVFIHKIREFIVLLEIVLEKLYHKDMFELKKSQHKDINNLEKEQRFIQKKLNKLYSLKYLFRANLILSKLAVYIIPFMLLLLDIYFLSVLKVLPNTNKYPLAASYYKFFGGLGILIFSIPILLMLSNYIKKINLWLMNTFQVSFSRNLMLQIVVQILLIFFMTILMLKGFSLLENTNLNNFKEIFSFFKDIVFSIEFPNKNFSTIFNKDVKNIENYILLTKLIIGIMGTIILFDIVSSYLKQYDQFFYEQKIKRYLLPPELLKVVTSFLIMSISIVYLYFMITAYPYSSPQPTIDKNNNTVSQEIINLTKVIEEQKSLEDLLPFGIFLALLGTLLSVAGRDIMANYFTGLSMKMDIPYEIGDRVKIGSSKILEVRNIGLRNDKFYEISSNSIISIPHSVLASSSIKNYTYPTLDYRDKLSIYVQNNPNNSEKTPREAEKVLLTSAFINTGVKLPKIGKKIVDKIKNIDMGTELLKKYSDSRYSLLETELSSETSQLASKIDDVWKKLEDVDKEDNKNKSSFFKNLFIENLPLNISENKEENLYIKKVIIAIINSVIEYQNLIDEYLYSKSDKYGIRRKYDVFKDKDEKIVKNFASVLVNISFYYYMLANRLWELKDKQTSFAQKRKIDNAMIQILNVPRVSSTQELNDSNQKIWKVTLLITLELGEQRDETLHHINMYIDAIWDIFLSKENKNDKD